MKRKKFKDFSYNARRENILGYSFLSLWLIGFLVFTIGPLLYTLFLSFNEVKHDITGWTTTWIGMGNYIQALMTNLYFRPALIEFVLLEATYVPFIVIISFILAILLNQKIKFQSGFRLIYFLPVVVLSGPVMYNIMEFSGSDSGNVGSIFIYSIVYNFSPFFGNIISSLFTNFSMVLWFTGIPIVLFLNGLQKINKNLYEAAQIDGANSWQILWKITLPIVKPIALVVAIFTIVQIGIFPINPVGDMIQTSIYNTVGGLGLASTFAWIYSFVIFIFIGIAFLLLRDTSDRKLAKKVKLSSIQIERNRKIQEKRMAQFEKRRTKFNKKEVE